MEPTGNTQERTASPSICTVQAPHCAIPQPNFVPVSPKTSRSTHSKGMSAGTSTDFETPLTFKFVIKPPLMMPQHIRSAVLLRCVRIPLESVYQGSRLRDFTDVED